MLIFLNDFKNLFLAVLGLHCCEDFPQVVPSGDYSLAAVMGLHVAFASPVAGTGSRQLISSCGARVHSLQHVDSVALQHAGFSPPGIKLVSPALESELFTLEPPGKPCIFADF